MGDRNAVAAVTGGLRRPSRAGAGMPALRGRALGPCLGYSPSPPQAFKCLSLMNSVVHIPKNLKGGTPSGLIL